MPKMTEDDWIKALLGDEEERDPCQINTDPRTNIWNFMYTIQESTTALVKYATPFAAKLLNCDVKDIRVATSEAGEAAVGSLGGIHSKCSKVEGIYQIHKDIPITSYNLDYAVRQRGHEGYLSSAISLITIFGHHEETEIKNSDGAKIVCKADEPLPAVIANAGSKIPVLFVRKKDAARISYRIQRSYEETEISVEPVLPGNMLDTILSETIKPFSKKSEFKRLGIAPSRGLLFTGDPGNGKTLTSKFLQTMARNQVRVPVILVDHAMIHEAIQKGTVDELFCMSGLLVFDDLNVGLFDRAQNPDAAGALLSAMDGPLYDSNAGISVRIFTTNEEPDRIDPAFLRPGRIDRVFKFGNPGYQERKNLAAKWPQEALDILGTPEKIGRRTEDMSFAEVDALKNHALRLKVVDDIEIDLDQCIEELSMMLEEKAKFTYDKAKSNNGNMGFAPAARKDDETEWVNAPSRRIKRKSKGNKSKELL